MYRNFLTLTFHYSTLERKSQAFSVKFLKISTLLRKIPTFFSLTLLASSIRKVNL